MTVTARKLWGLTSADREWATAAVCAQIDPEIFFPDGGSDTKAKRICARCPVTAECLADALGRNERYGVWGGLNVRERNRLRRHNHHDVQAA